MVGPMSRTDVEGRLVVHVTAILRLSIWFTDTLPMVRDVGAWLDTVTVTGDETLLLPAPSRTDAVME